MAETLFHIRCVEAKHVSSSDSNGFSDPFMVFKAGKESVKTSTFKKSLFPVWHEDLSLLVKNDVTNLEFALYDYDFILKNDLLGSATLSIDTIVKAGGFAGWVTLRDEKRPESGVTEALVSIVVDKDIATWKAQKGKSDYVQKRARSLFDALSAQEAVDQKKEGKIPFSLFVGSWNVGNAAPQDDLSAWIPKNDLDFYVFGMQESTYDARKPYDNNKDDLVGTLHAHVGKDDYFLVAFSELWQIRLAVFAHKRTRDHVHRVQIGKEATGIARVVGNKGGVVITFDYHDLSLCFVNCHLAAHQGEAERRNRDVSEILSEVKLGRMDILNQFHHCFWLGDLNYRLDYGDQGEKKKPSEEQFKEMVELINKKQYAELFTYDQLRKAMEEEKAFIGFTDAPCVNFPPTFSMHRNEELSYNPKRSPAWCDRILWKSLKGVEAKLRTFDSVPAVMSSDHKPVFAIFDMDALRLPSAVDPTRGQAMITITNLKGKDLPALDVGGTSDPFVEFSSHFLSEGGLVTTPVIKKNLNPHWEKIPTLKLNYNSTGRLEKSYIAIRVWDHDTGRNDDLIGSAVLNLDEIISGEKVEFNLRLTRGGLAAGYLSGEAQITYAHSSFKK